MNATMIPTPDTPDTPDKPGAALLLSPGRDGWQIARESGGDTFTFPAYEAALDRACAMAREAGAALYVRGANDKLIGMWEFYGTSTRPESLHVRPAGAGWALRRRDQPSLGFFDVKEQALSEARRLARDEGLDLVVHYETGEVQKERSYDA